ncbi:hypothetical protein [Mucilaginibacter sp. L3T2-6]|uniref:hypothetical protein n=1 Tax=Mucilaginibacter sp. L3T2-6 TaxID=3062491 RepID=UPI00267655F6|nr:hypothetical protein [Mucilaginibacter sp. L3T2-6]MDO3643873.1 hypothetical protein [Mucilaginibacter sp. L3T2-6]MDV6216404.1 hypothetical protein [Mucilaginibacter sp. L3T2-6]
MTNLFDPHHRDAAGRYGDHKGSLINWIFPDDRSERTIIIYCTAVPFEQKSPAPFLSAFD